METLHTLGAPQTIKLLSALRGHLQTSGLPEPATVSINPRQATVDVQPAVTDHDDPVEVIGALLLWTHRVSGITGTWWHIGDTGRLHVRLVGRLGCGIGVTVYNGLPYRAVAEWVHLDADAHDSVSPDELYWLATQLREQRCTAA